MCACDPSAFAGVCVCVIPVHLRVCVCDPSAFAGRVCVCVREIPVHLQCVCVFIPLIEGADS